MKKQATKSADLSEYKDIFKELDNLNPDSTILSENSLSTVDDWISTGSYALNAICSGSIYKGIPVGRITGLVGPEACGKTMIMNKIFANAQKKGMIPIVWDTESAEDARMAEAVGCDASRMKYCPVDTIESCRNQIWNFLDNVIKAGKQGKFIIGIDSLGNLNSSKEVGDLEKNKDAADMGLRARALKSMLRALTYKTAKAKIPIIYTNHIYQNPTEMWESVVKNQSGGSGPKYLSSLTIQLSQKPAKIADNEEKEKVAIAHKISGIILGAITVKNRFIPPFLKTELYLNFKTGLDRFIGLTDMVEAYGVLQKDKNTFYLSDGTKLGTLKSWKDDVNIWENEILPKLDEVLQKEFSYSSEKYDEIKNDLKELNGEG